MIEIEQFIKLIGADFFTGVPDSQLKPLCNYLVNTYSIDKEHHIIAANEGNCTALAAGYYLATGKIPVVYMQNSGEGNIINPVASLLNEKVYAIPMIFIIGWRGQPGIHDEPQHVFQGEVTLPLLRDLDINAFVIEQNTDIADVEATIESFRGILQQGKSVAFVVKKDAFNYDEKVYYHNNNLMKREEILQHIVKVSKMDPIISTTGKASRELFEIREESKAGHQYDFLTVGSMGHSSSIALGVAIQKPESKVWCIDGDGAVLMHMGAMAVIGSTSPDNLIHVVINNCAHETVGGMPTVANSINLTDIAKACGYKHTFCVKNFEELDTVLCQVKTAEGLSFIEVKASIGSREDLGRPTTTTIQNKTAFMHYLESIH